MADTAPKKILVVDDEPDVTDLLVYTLKAEGFVVEAVNNPNASIGLARTFLPDLVILDVMMPELNGIQICRMLRADPQLKNVPVFFLTAKAEENDRIQGLESGADDYICKPFSTKEIVLRVQSMLRRTTESAPAVQKKLQAGDIVVDIERHEVLLHGSAIDLTATEFKLLRLITVWNYETDIETRTVDTHVRRLREKLGDQAEWIETIRGVGYRMAEQKAFHA
jgi:two-component system phosphate regulon response regulator PhoB